MKSDITFCAYEKCPNTNCLRHYNNAPENDIYVSWFAVRPRENGECDYRLLRKGELKNENC